MEEKKYKRRRKNRFRTGEDFEIFQERERDHRKSDKGLSICDTNIDGA